MSFCGFCPEISAEELAGWELTLANEVEATGIVEEFEFTTADRQRLYLLTDEENANYLVNRDAELVFTDATVVEVD